MLQVNSYFPMHRGCKVTLYQDACCPNDLPWLKMVRKIPWLIDRLHVLTCRTVPGGLIDRLRCDTWRSGGGGRLLIDCAAVLAVAGGLIDRLHCGTWSIGGVYWSIVFPYFCFCLFLFIYRAVNDRLNDLYFVYFLICCTSNRFTLMQSNFEILFVHYWIAWFSSHFYLNLWQFLS